MTKLARGEGCRGVANDDLGWIANFIWGIADDVLRDLYVRGKYRDVIPPMVVLRRLDSVLERSKKDVLTTVNPIGNRSARWAWAVRAHCAYRHDGAVAATQRTVR